MLEHEKVQIDGVKSGIIVRIMNRKATSYILTSNGKPRLFNNLAVAKVTAPGIIKNSDFKYYIKIGKIIVDIDDCNHIGDTWEFFYENKLYIVKELNIRRTTTLGYICFEKGESKRCDREYGEKRQYELFKCIRDIVGGILTEKGKYGISSIKKGYKEYVIQVLDTTGKIHILYNSKLMSINQLKRSKKERCLPFNKVMDKYLTFYIYSDKDVSESIKNDGDTKIESILSYIIDDLKEYYPDATPTYVPVDFTGYIELEELNEEERINDNNNKVR